jgi:hypothetical protein
MARNISDPAEKGRSVATRCSRGLQTALGLAILDTLLALADEVIN